LVKLEKTVGIYKVWVEAGPSPKTGAVFRWPTYFFNKTQAATCYENYCWQF